MSFQPLQRMQVARAVDVVVIGAGHSGLAMSYCLGERSIDHIVLERGEIANSWRRERWDSLRLLTPNWQCRLPGQAYAGDDPDGFMRCAEVVEFLDRYAARIAVPARTCTAVTSVEPADRGYRVMTDRGHWSCRAVVVASGAFNVPVVPAAAEALPASIQSLTAFEYRNPSQLESSGVLVVGASASGLQLASEIRRTGRAVTLAVGEHVRMPRSYRGRDIQWWLDRSGVLDQTYLEVDDIERARRVPSPQLVGTPEHATLDLNTLRADGVRIVGRLAGISQGRALLSGALRNHCAMADLKLNRLLSGFDAWASESGVDDRLEPPSRPAPTLIDESPCLALRLASAGIGSVVWATGMRADHSWLKVPVFDRKGRIRHAGGVVDAPGMYVLGLPFMRRRKSSYLHGAGDDAADLAEHLAGVLRDGTLAGVAPERCASA